VDDFLAELHARVSEMGGGKVADYIPELGKADPATFGIALATVDGEDYATGDSGHAFTIQSVSKPFMYGYALQHYGRDYVLRHVGVEPTGEAFNSIVLDEVANRPFNPMVNAGAIAVAALMPGNSLEERMATMINLFSDLAGRWRDRRGCVPVGARHRPSQPGHCLYDAEYRHDRRRSHRDARPLFPPVLYRRHQPRPRHDGGDARQ
jgi:glutaminase